MRILEIIYGLASGGAERLVVDLSNELAKTEDVTLLVLKDVNQFYAKQISEKVHVDYALLPVGTHLSQHLFVYKYINRLKPDIVHFHSQARYYVLLACLFHRKSTKFFMTIHNDVEKSYLNGISGLQVRLSKVLGNTRFITISEENQRQFKKHYPNYKSKLIVNGRAQPKLSGESIHVSEEINSLKINADTIVYIHIARCMPVKNQALLIKAFNRYVAYGANAILIIIGDLFDSNLGKELKHIACNHIHFLGLKHNVYDYLAFADVFCLSSLQEGMPMTIIEAVLTGLPIISTPVCGAVDAVINGKNGLLTKDFEENSYYEILKSFEKNKAKLKMGALEEKEHSIYNISYCSNEHLKWFKEG